MALTVTSLNGAITLNTTQVRLTAFTNPSTGPIGPQTVLMVDGERMTVADATLSPVLSVTRGDYGTKASAHGTLSPVTYGLTSDFTTDASTNGVANVNQMSIGADNSNFTPPVGNCTIYITKASAAAITINSPAKDQTNTITWISLTAAAHTITYTPGFYGNTVSSDVVTFPSTIGAGWTMVARNGLWNAAPAGGGTTGGVTGPA